MILVDTSVWIDHLRRGHAGLAALLDEGQVICHPFVIGEIALGRLANRRQILSLLTELPAATVVRHDEALALIDARALAGTGIGWIDLNLLGSALVERLPIWTLDRRLASVARGLGVEWKEQRRPEHGGLSPSPSPPLRRPPGPNVR